jgi:hypothetical protein
MVSNSGPYDHKTRINLYSLKDTLFSSYLDGDEVCLTFVGNGLGQHSLTSTRRTIEQDTLGRAHTKLEELFGMFYRVLDSFLEFQFDVFQTTDIVPFDSRDFDDSFAKGRRVGDTEGVLTK